MSSRMCCASSASPKGASACRGGGGGGVGGIDVAGDFDCIHKAKQIGDGIEAGLGWAAMGSALPGSLPAGQAEAGSRQAHLRRCSPDHGRLVMAQLEEGCPQLTPALFLQTIEIIEEQPRAARKNCVRELQTTRVEPGCWQLSGCRQSARMHRSISQATPTCAGG